MLATLQHIDFTILNFIHDNLSSPFLDQLMPLISSLADNGLIWIVITLALMFRRKERKHGLTLCIAILIEFIVCNCILKPLIHRIRPYDINTSVSLLISPLKDYSFPSAHTAVSFAAATVLYSINKKVGLCAYLLAAAIGFSRLYLYVHFPSDVLAGIVFGLLSGIAAIYIIRKLPDPEPPAS